MKNNIGGGIHAFEKQVHILKKGWVTFIKKFNIVHIIGGSHFSEVGSN